MFAWHQNRYHLLNSNNGKQAHSSRIFVTNVRGTFVGGCMICFDHSWPICDAFMAYPLIICTDNVMSVDRSTDLQFFHFRFGLYFLILCFHYFFAVFYGLLSVMFFFFCHGGLELLHVFLAWHVWCIIKFFIVSVQ